VLRSIFFIPAFPSSPKGAAFFTPFRGKKLHKGGGWGKKISQPYLDVKKIVENSSLEC